MLRQLSAHQIAEWEAYNRLDPIGEERDDFRIAHLMSLIFNIHLQENSKKQLSEKDLKTALDFMVEWDDEIRNKKKAKKQSWQEMKEILLTIAKTQNKNVERQERLQASLKKPPTLPVANPLKKRKL